MTFYYCSCLVSTERSAKGPIVVQEENVRAPGMLYSQALHFISSLGAFVERGAVRLREPCLALFQPPGLASLSAEAGKLHIHTSQAPVLPAAMSVHQPRFKLLSTGCCHVCPTHVSQTGTR